MADQEVTGTTTTEFPDLATTITALQERFPGDIRVDKELPFNRLPTGAR